MIALQIANIYLKMSEQDFETELSNAETNYSSNTSISHKSSQLRMRKSAQEMLKVEISSGNGNVFTIVGERDAVSGDVIFKPLKIKSIDESFYMTIYADPDDIGQDEDPAIFFARFISDLCKKNNGTVAYIDTAGTMEIVKDGSNVKPDSLALVDENGEVYTTTGSRSVWDADEDGEDATKKFRINKFWQEWLQENPDIMAQANTYQTPADKMNFIGKALIQKKLNDEIDFDEFQDVFIQICSYGVVDDSTVLNFYQLLK